MCRRRTVQLVSTLVIIPLFIASSAVAGNGNGPGTGSVPPGQAAPTNVSPPTISGSTVVGQLLTASPGSWTGPGITFTYQWQRCNSSGGACGPVTGASGETYALTSSDTSYTIRVSATASNKNGSTVATSDATTVVVSAPPSPTTTTSSSTTTPTTATTTTATTTTATTTTTSSTTSSPYFAADPATGNLRPFDYFDLGLGAVPVSSTPTGGSSPGIVRDTIGSDGRPAYELTVTSTAHASNATGSDSVYLWNGPRAYDGYTSPGVVTWYHLHIMFPAKAFVPTTGEWNMVVVHHNDGGYTKFSCSQEVGNIAFDVTTDYPVVNGAVGQNPHLKARVMGGDSCAPQKTWYDLGPLQYDHWYDVLYQVKWDPTTAGFFNLWVDGTQRSSYQGPTLYKRPDGSVSYTWLDLVNYRLHASWNSTIYFGATKIGPTQGSVQ